MRADVWCGSIWEESVSDPNLIIPWEKNLGFRFYSPMKRGTLRGPYPLHRRYPFGWLPPYFIDLIYSNSGNILGRIHLPVMNCSTD